MDFSHDRVRNVQVYETKWHEGTGFIISRPGAAGAGSRIYGCLVDMFSLHVQSIPTVTRTLTWWWRSSADGTLAGHRITLSVGAPAYILTHTHFAWPMTSHRRTMRRRTCALLVTSHRPTMCRVHTPHRSVMTSSISWRRTRRRLRHRNKSTWFYVYSLSCFIYCSTTRC